ncbi:hypothetical protein [Sinorhizobium sp. BG8]|uniref:hypothetical protein n=1 Tax=Sinorhizobium sp. BG8 TaxID=2613773 RepID=UPI00193E73CA|nr:hypothetical protein [Sinorhizobium sp. BG8]QRM54577.1 hypothetical protein F3Y30_08480 [Sinorhizobium sp. BG8]
MFRKIILGLVGLCLLTAGTDSAADPPDMQLTPKCARHSELVDLLQSLYAEKLSGVGLVSPYALAELYVAGEGNWTLILTGTDGLSCLILSGNGWQSLPPPPGQRA